MRRFTLLLAIAAIVSLAGLPVGLFADGGDPLPWPPAAPVLSADGGDPLPWPPVAAAQVKLAA